MNKRLVFLDMGKWTPSRAPGPGAGEEMQSSPSLILVLWEQRDAADHVGSGLAAIHVYLFIWVLVRCLWLHLLFVICMPQTG